MNKSWGNECKMVFECLRDDDTGIIKIPHDEYSKLKNDEQKEYLKEQLDVVMSRTSVSNKRNINCLWHKDAHASMRYYDKSGTLFCFACSSMSSEGNYDIFSLYMKIFNVGFKDARKALEDIFVEPRLTNRKKGFRTYQKSIGYKPLKSALSAFNYVVNERGVSEDTIDKFGVSSWTYKDKEIVVVPCDDNYESRRVINPNDAKFKYWNRRNRNVSTFNTSALIDAEKIFVVEGVFDALSIIDCAVGVTAVATNSVSNTKLLIERIHSLKNDNLELILMFDNDWAGRNSAKSIINELGENLFILDGMEYSRRANNHFKGFKDVNEAYVADKAETKKTLLEIIRYADFEKEERMK